MSTLNDEHGDKFKTANFQTVYKPLITNLTDLVIDLKKQPFVASANRGVWDTDKEPGARKLNVWRDDTIPAVFGTINVTPTSLAEAAKVTAWLKTNARHYNIKRMKVVGRPNPKGRDGDADEYHIYVMLVNPANKTAGAKTAKTFAQARADILAHLKAEGWKVKEFDINRMKPMKVPWAKSPNGHDTLWFQAQAVYLNAHSLSEDIRNLTPQAFMAMVHDTIESRKMGAGAKTASSKTAGFSIEYTDAWFAFVGNGPFNKDTIEAIRQINDVPFKDEEGTLHDGDVTLRVLRKDYSGPLTYYQEKEGQVRENIVQIQFPKGMDRKKLLAALQTVGKKFKLKVEALSGFKKPETRGRKATDAMGLLASLDLELTAGALPGVGLDKDAAALEEVAKLAALDLVADQMIGRTILEQMGGQRRLSLMLGVKQLILLKDGVAFAWPNRESSKGNYVEIRLNGADLYDVAFFNASRSGKKLVKKFDDLYAEDLVNTFERQTGWYLRMASQQAHLLVRAAGEQMAKFEEGVSADPTKNMSPEDAAEWKKQNEANKDKFKTADLGDGLVAEGCPDNLDEGECAEWESNTEKYKDSFKSAGLTWGGSPAEVALVTLYNAGEKKRWHGGFGVYKDKRFSTPVLKKLMEDGFIEGEHFDQNNRPTNVSVTPKGQAVAAKLLAADAKTASEDWVMAPESILRRAVVNGLLSLDQANSRTVKDAALEVAEDLRSTWPEGEGEGFGSSDGTFVVKDMLERAGFKTAFVNGKLAILSVPARLASKKTASWEYAGGYLGGGKWTVQAPLSQLTALQAALPRQFGRARILPNKNGPMQTLVTGTEQAMKAGLAWLASQGGTPEKRPIGMWASGHPVPIAEAKIGGDLKTAYQEGSRVPDGWDNGQIDGEKKTDEPGEEGSDVPDGSGNKNKRASFRMAATPKYQDYVEKKKNKGEKPLSKEDWERKVLNTGHSGDEVSLKKDVEKLLGKKIDGLTDGDIDHVVGVMERRLKSDHSEEDFKDYYGGTPEEHKKVLSELKGMKSKRKDQADAQGERDKEKGKKDKEKAESEKETPKGRAKDVATSIAKRYKEDDGSTDWESTVRALKKVVDTRKDYSNLDYSKEDFEAAITHAERQLNQSKPVEKKASFRMAATPKYQDYVEKKKNKGEKPLSKEDWERKVLNTGHSGDEVSLKKDVEKLLGKKIDGLTDGDIDHVVGVMERRLKSDHSEEDFKDYYGGTPEEHKKVLSELKGMKSKRKDQADAQGERDKEKGKKDKEKAESEKETPKGRAKDVATSIAKRYKEDDGSTDWESTVRALKKVVDTRKDYSNLDYSKEDFEAAITHAERQLNQSKPVEKKAGEVVDEMYALASNKGDVLYGATLDWDDAKDKQYWRKHLNKFIEVDDVQDADDFTSVLARAKAIRLYNVPKSLAGRILTVGLPHSKFPDGHQAMAAVKQYEKAPSAYSGPPQQKRQFMGGEVIEEMYALVMDGYMLGATDTWDDARSKSFWRRFVDDDHVAEGKLFTLMNVPLALAEKFKDVGTRAQMFDDGYSAWAVAKRFTKGSADRLASGNPKVATIQDGNTLQKLVEMEMESIGATGDFESKFFRRVESAAAVWDSAVEDALLNWVKKAPQTTFNMAAAPLRRAQDAHGIVEVLMKHRGGAGYLYYMEMEGAGVGTWDGDWDVLFQDPHIIHDLSKHMASVLRSQFQKLNKAISDAAFSAMDDDVGDGHFASKAAARIPSGLYGHTKRVQADCDSCINRVQKSAARIAKTVYGRNEQVAEFLSIHAKRANSLPAKILVAALKGLGPRVASDITAAEARMDRLVELRLASLDLTANILVNKLGSNPVVLTSIAPQGVHFAKVIEAAENLHKLGFATFDGVKISKLTDGDSQTGEGIKQTDKKAGARSYGLYGYAEKVAAMGLQACTDLRHQAGRHAYDLHSRRADNHSHISDYFGNHSKQAKCMYSRLLAASYPALGTKVASTAEAPRSVQAWLEWVE